MPDLTQKTESEVAQLIDLLALVSAIARKAAAEDELGLGAVWKRGQGELTAYGDGCKVIQALNICDWVLSSVDA